MTVFRTIRFRGLALAGALAVALPALVHAQEMPRIDGAHNALLIHGNFCGPGNRGPGHPPVDALDLASDVLHLHAARDRLDRMLAREN
ncbi:hypothetical protein FV223_28970, partial [Methylobacterium sp. WL116]